MDREELKGKLDIDKNGKVNLDDVIAFINGNVRKALAIGLGVGLLAGVPIGAFLF